MELITRLADALEYPQAHPGPIIAECLEAVPDDAAPPLRAFRDFVTGRTTAELQELYTRTFDFNPDCCLYAGHHLLGDDDRRAAFMARLNAAYRKARFSAGTELPDHVPVMLRYAAGRAGDRETEELVEECVLPALATVTAKLQKRNDPWADLTRAISLAVEKRLCASAAVVDTGHDREKER